jgi:hypothetical protein
LNLIVIILEKAVSHRERRDYKENQAVAITAHITFWVNPRKSDNTLLSLCSLWLELRFLGLYVRPATSLNSKLQNSYQISPSQLLNRRAEYIPEASVLL